MSAKLNNFTVFGLLAEQAEKLPEEDKTDRKTTQRYVHVCKCSSMCSVQCPHVPETKTRGSWWTWFSHL